MPCGRQTPNSTNSWLTKLLLHRLADSDSSRLSDLALKASPFARWHLWHALRKPFLRYGVAELAVANPL